MQNFTRNHSCHHLPEVLDFLSSRLQQCFLSRLPSNLFFWWSCLWITLETWVYASRGGFNFALLVIVLITPGHLTSKISSYLICICTNNDLRNCFPWSFAIHSAQNALLLFSLEYTNLSQHPCYTVCFVHQGFYRGFPLETCRVSHISKKMSLLILTVNAQFSSHILFGKYLKPLLMTSASEVSFTKECRATSVMVSDLVFNELPTCWCIALRQLRSAASKKRQRAHLTFLRFSNHFSRDLRQIYLLSHWPCTFCSEYSSELMSCVLSPIRKFRPYFQCFCPPLFQFGSEFNSLPPGLSYYGTPFNFCICTRLQSFILWKQVQWTVSHLDSSGHRQVK